MTKGKAKGEKVPTISAKVLGSMELDEFCPRCFWIKMKHKLPWQMFPGIFASIDGFVKKVTAIHHRDRQLLPEWMEQAWPGARPEKAPHYTKFCFPVPGTEMVLRGGPDEILRMPDGSLVIADYKTTRITKYQDLLMPMYQTQLNAYAYLAENTGMGSVSDLALIYYEPQTDLERVGVVGTIIVYDGEPGFTMPFKAAVKRIQVDTGRIAELVVRAWEITRAGIPAGKEGCKECEAVAAIAAAIS